MPDTLEKLRPDCDLQCYFQRPSAIAALSSASANGFTLSGSWRQQYDWAVVEWNRDNTFEHPAFRNLPDGDLSGLTLTYDESRDNCLPMDSDLVGGGEWPYLRIWLDGETLPRLVRLRDHAVAISGGPVAATAELQLTGTPAVRDYVGLVWLSEQYYYQVAAGDTLESIVSGLAAVINSFPDTVRASASGTRITLTAPVATANWNRVGVYGYVGGEQRTEIWSPWFATFSGGRSPSVWRVHLDLGNLNDKDGNPISMSSVRKMRWTYAADEQTREFGRSEFAVTVSNWSVSGANRAYRVAGNGSRRIEDNALEINYEGAWSTGQGNFSGGTIASTAETGARLNCTYRADVAHDLYLGTRGSFNGGQVSISIDGGASQTKSLLVPTEDVLMRVPLGTLTAGEHSVVIELTGSTGVFYFDFLEIAIPTNETIAVSRDARVTLATDWDTDHSICLAPERTAWMIQSLGFGGRQNHYVGALWFYELLRAGHQYASATVQFTGAPVFGWGELTELTIAREGDGGSAIVLTHLHYVGDTAETIAKAFEFRINREYMPVWAEASGGVLTLRAREMGVGGNTLTLAARTTSQGFSAVCSGSNLSGGTDGEWRTDLTAVPRINRAARDWSRSFFAALRGYGIDAAAALSTELQHGDPSPEAGIAQRCPAGDAVIVNTPALQTNFSPASIEFWKVAFRDLAQTMQDAGLTPYLQFGETQWWYFRDNRSGMPFYDAYTKAGFLAQYGREMAVITDHTADPASYPDEVAYLPTLIGAFTNAVMSYVRESFPACRFEALYPLDVNETALNRLVNFPAANWTPSALDCLKTESFGFTYARDLDKCHTSIVMPQGCEFPPDKSAHLVGISYPDTPWMKEMRLAKAEGLESVVLFALDQFCLIGYPVPLPEGSRRSGFQD